ncbi:MAG: hypothetical protein ACRD9L_10800, partial [Bryobacteraceae bacterium]
GLFLAHFSDLWNELKEPFAAAYAIQLIAQRRGLAVRARRSSAAQMTRALPGFQQIKIPVAIRIPAATRKGKLSKSHHAPHWGQTLDVPVHDFGLYLRLQEERAKNLSVRQREKLKPLREVYRIARVGSGGDFTMPMKAALATPAAKKKAKAAGFGSGWLFAEA